MVIDGNVFFFLYLKLLGGKLGCKFMDIDNFKCGK